MTHSQSVPISAPRARTAPVFCFSVQAEAEPGVMPRALDLFAKRGLVPSRWVSDVSGPRGRDLSIDIQARGLTPQLSAQIAQCLRQIPGVGAVLTSEKGGAAGGGIQA
jgi:acetolactate synthase small subunit